MDSAIAMARTTPDAVSATMWEARAAAGSGRFQAAHEQYDRAAQEALRDDARELAAQWTAEDAEAMAVAGTCQDVARRVGRALELSRDNFTVERASRAFALCGAEDAALGLTRDLTSRFPSATLTTRLQVPVTAAIGAARRGESARALQLLEAVEPYDHVPAAEFWPSYVRGQAYLRLKQPREASAQFGHITDHRGEAPTSPLYSLSLLGSARASALAGDLDAARERYRQFLDSWNDADANLAVLREAREEYGRIR
jgi:tetratricopeptide (TPR) repeat protein